MNLILLESNEIDGERRAQLTGERARHIREVLRATVGSELRIGIVDGPLGRGTVAAIDGGASSAGSRAGVVLQCAFDRLVPEPPGIDLLLAVPRPKVLNRLWAQLAALGVARIILTNAERVERPYFDTHVLQERHWRPLLIEGLQQACDTRLPAVSVHRRFRVLVEDELDRLSDAAVRLVADPASGATVASALAGRAGTRVLLAVGPEGGWNPFELELLEAHGFAPVGLGRRTLRSDTACVALLAVVHAALRAASPV